MKDFGRMFNILAASADGMLHTVGTFLVAVEGDILRLKPRAGRAPKVEEFLAAVVRLMRAYEIAEGPLERSLRHPIRLTVLEDSEGTEKCVLEEELDTGYPVERTIISSSSFGGTVELFGTSIYDLLDVLVADGRITIESTYSGRQYYRFDERADGLDSIVMIPPREISQESGWIQPGEKPRFYYGNADAVDWEE